MMHRRDIRAARRATMGQVCLLLIVVAACTPDARDQAMKASGAEPNGRPTAGAAAKSPPVDPGVVQRDVEGWSGFSEPRKAVCPKRIPDRHEERRRYPAIDVLNGLRYVAVSDDQSRGAYEKVISITPAGQEALRGDVEDEADRYVITIATRAYVAGSERFATAADGSGRLVVSFRWWWNPTNALGERLDLRAPQSQRVEQQGRATYARGADGWRLQDVWLESDGTNYMR